MKQLARSRIPPERLAGLRAAARRNQALLSASARGIRSAAEHIASLKREKQPLRTYDSAGESVEYRQHRSTVEKRA